MVHKELFASGLFLDTGRLDAVRHYLALGVIRGVTTNPTILLKDGVKGGWQGIEKHCKTLADIIAPLPLSVEVTAHEADEMRRQAIEMSGWATNMVVKIPIHGPLGESHYLKVVHELESQHGAAINVTAMMSSQQCLLAAMAGARYVSLFGGRVNNMGYNCCDEIRRTRRLLEQFDLPAKIIVGSTREVLNIIEWFDAGAHVVTALPQLIDGMLVHPFSKETVQMFLADAQKQSSA